MDISLKERVNAFIKEVKDMELEQSASIRSMQRLEESIRELMDTNKNNKEALDIATHAIEIIRGVSDEAVKEAYDFLEGSLNASLERMFTKTTRKIRIKEYTRSNQYPQLELELIVSNGKKRSLKADSGHGIAQVVSILSILSLIVITNSRRILVMDEVISGLSENTLRIMTDIFWTFTEIGFQFIINEHGYIPKGAKVYELEMIADVSGIKKEYIDEKGKYLTGENKEETGKAIFIQEEKKDNSDWNTDIVGV